MNYTHTQGNTPIILHAPHGGLNITELALESLIIDDLEIRSELGHMTDLHTDKLAIAIGNRIFSYDSSTLVSMFINNDSRLVIDPERFPDEREEMNAVGMGAVYTHGSHRQRIRLDDENLKKKLIQTNFTPYAQGLENAVTGCLKKYHSAVIVDIHSYASKPLPYELHQEGVRPEICIGTDTFHSPNVQTNNLIRILEEYGYDVDLNSPFSGTYVPLKYYGKDDKVSSFMFEIRRDVYMNEKTRILDKAKYKYLMHALSEAVDSLIIR